MDRFHHLQAWALVVLGLWLIVSPFIVPGFVTGSLAVNNSFLIGVIALLLGAAGFVHARNLDQWIDMALGIGSAKPPHARR